MKPAILLARDAFREAVFSRDNYTCVFCNQPARDAHHILERKLWECGGYYLDNGASVCEKHHLECEMTLISVEDVRAACGIQRALIPDHLYDDDIYDKWGNQILPTGQRLKGELFHDESVQKILAAGGVLGNFCNQVKYPRTPHLPWSDGMNDDDRMLKDVSWFLGKEVIITEKRDGENTSLYSDYFHARSIDGRSHPSRDWVKNLWGRINYELPEGWRICGENLYAKHSIGYEDLDTYFEGFSMWDEKNNRLHWDEMTAYFDILGIKTVPVLDRCLFDEERIKALYDSKKDWSRSEGYVVTLVEGFNYRDFRRSVAKFVRKGHVQTTKHWMQGQRIIPNGLAYKG